MKNSVVGNGPLALGCAAMIGGLVSCISANQPRAEEAVATVSVQLADPSEFDKMKESKGVTLQLVRPKPVDTERDVLDSCGDAWNKKLEAHQKEQKKSEAQKEADKRQGAPQPEPIVATRMGYRKDMYACLKKPPKPQAAAEAK